MHTPKLHIDINESIENKEYMSDGLFKEATGFLASSLSCYSSLSQISEYDHRYKISTINIPALCQAVGASEFLELVQANSVLTISINEYGVISAYNENNKFLLSLKSNEFIQAYIFDAITNGTSIVDRIKLISQKTLISSCIPNLYATPQKSVGDSDDLMIAFHLALNVAFLFVYFILNKAKPVLSNLPEHQLVELVETIGGKLYSNLKSREGSEYRVSTSRITEKEMEILTSKFPLIFTSYGGGEVDDWHYLYDGRRGSHRAFSPSLGICRKYNIAEYYNYH